MIVFCLMDPNTSREGACCYPPKHSQILHRDEIYLMILCFFSMMPHGHQTKKCCSPYTVERVNPFYSGHDWWPWRVGTILVHVDKTSLTCFFCTPSLSSSWHIYDLSWSAGWGETLRPTHSWVCYYQVPYGSLRDQYIWHHPIFINIWISSYMRT